MVMSGSELSIYQRSTLPQSRSVEMLDRISDRSRSKTLPNNRNTPDKFYDISAGDVPMFSKNIPSTFSVAYSSDREEISFSNRY